MPQHDVEMPIPLLVRHVDEVGVLGHADDVDDAVDAAHLLGRITKQALGVGTLGGIAGPRDAIHFGRDVVGQPLIKVDAEDLSAGLVQGVSGLTADALAGADQDQVAIVEAELALVVGDLAVVSARHESVCAMVSAQWTRV